MIYEYKDLKGVIKVNDEVSAVRGMSNYCPKLNNDGSNRQKITRVDDEWFWVDDCRHSYEGYGFLELYPAPDNIWFGDCEAEHGYNCPKATPSWDNLKPNDFVEDSKGYKKKVLEVFTQSVLLSEYSDFDIFDIAGCFYTIKELQKDGYTVVGSKPEEPKEMTVKQISEALGYTIKVVEE